MEQKELFGSSSQYINYVECNPNNDYSKSEQCQTKEITGYPTWTFSDGSRIEGKSSLRTLAEKSGCVLQNDKEQETCIQSCIKSMEEGCIIYPDSPLCPEDISRRCELNCGREQVRVVFLNEDFPINIGESVIVEDYDNMEIVLLGINKTGCSEVGKRLKGSTRESGYLLNETTGEILTTCVTELFTANLKITRSDEIKFVDINHQEDEEVFSVRIDFVTFMRTGVSEPFAGVFGVYEKEVSGFWSRISNWIRKLFS